MELNGGGEPALPEFGAVDAFIGTESPRHGHGHHGARARNAWREKSEVGDIAHGFNNSAKAIAESEEEKQAVEDVPQDEHFPDLFIFPPVAGEEHGDGKEGVHAEEYIVI